jgi:signal transduction histidine kinase
MFVITEVLRQVGFTIGAALDIFLIAVLLRKRGGGLLKTLTLATLSAAGLWHTASAVFFFRLRLAEVETVFLLEAAKAGLALAPSFLLHLSLLWAKTKIKNWLAALLYLAAPLVWLAIENERWEIYHLWAGLSVTIAAVLCVYAARRCSEKYERRFFRVFAVALLAIPLAGALAGRESASVVLASLAPPFCFAYFVYRYNFLGLLIGRRVVFALNLGILFAFYLYLVYVGAEFVQGRWEAPAMLAAVALIFIGGLVWLPLYGWMNRFFQKRTRLYADLSKRLIEEAARILDLEKKLPFIAEEVGRSFRLRKVCVMTTGDPVLHGTFGPCPQQEDPAALAEIRRLVSERRIELANTARSDDRALSQLVAGLGFNYLFPLWYERRLTGLLFLDTAPRMFLDENEPVVLALSRQISSSIETCRVIEEKIDLERQFVKQEHYARLGMAAATIAHEIKNPLSSVKTLAQLMREDSEVKQKYDRDLAYMIGETDRLNKSVQQLLSFTRPAPEQRQEVNLTEELESMAEVFARQYATEQIGIERAISPGLELKHGNLEMVRQIVLNLVLNAIQVSKPGDKVRLEAEAGPEMNIRISVSDQGPGIPAEVRERVFEPFYTTQQRGTGLGLAIVRKNVHHLSGSIDIESPTKEGRGTRMVVTLSVE